MRIIIIVLSAWNFLTVNVIKWLPFLIHPGIFSYIPTWSKKTDNSLFFRHQNWAWLVFHNMKWSFGNFSYSNHWNGKQNWDFSNFKNQNRHYQLMFRCRFFGDNRKILKGPSNFFIYLNKTFQKVQKSHQLFLCKILKILTCTP